MIKKSYIAALQNKGVEPPLFLFPGIGGNLFIFRALVAELGEKFPVYALKSRGWDGREKPYTNINARVVQHVSDIRKVQSKGPYHLLGYCFGGVMALEVACALVQAGEEVAYLGAIDSTPGASSKLESGGADGGTRIKDKIMGRLQETGFQGLMFGVLESLKARSRVTKHILRKSYCDLRLLARLGVPVALTEQYISYYDYMMFRNHQASSYSGAVHLYWSSEDPDWGWAQSNGRIFDPEVALANWETVVAGGVWFEQLPGHHESIFVTPNVLHLGSILLRAKGWEDCHRTLQS